MVVGGGGGGGGGGGVSVTISGKAADGYLAGATVCLDVDGDMNCDANEPTTTTGAGGAFTLTIPEGVNAASYPIVVKVSETTIDEDSGLAVGKPYVLSAPAGESDFISPLTTVVHGMLQSNPALTFDDVVTQVKLSIGASSDISLFEDYVAAKQDANNAAADEYERLHRIAQVSAKVMAENYEAIMEAATAQQIDTAQSNTALLALVVNEALNELATAALTVDEAGEEFDLDAVTVETADVTNLADRVEETEAVASATKISIQSLLEQGVYWIWAEGEEFEYGHLEAGAEANRLEESWFVYDDSGTWVAVEDDASFYLGADGWIETAEEAHNYAVTYQTDGSAILDLDEADFTLKFSAAEVDVAGEPIRNYLGFTSHLPVAESITGEPVFSSGAKIYQVNFIAATDAYVLDNWFGCNDPQISDPSGNCNIVFGHASNTDFRPAQSFAELIYPSEPSGGNWFGVGEDMDIRIVQGGVVQITDTARRTRCHTARGNSRRCMASSS